jgi:hypothetical protein
MGWIYLIIVIAVIVYAIQNWQITLTIIVIGAVIYAISKVMKNNAEHRRRREAEEARRRAEEELRLRQYREQQESSLRQLIALCDNSLSLFEAGPNYLVEAERQLDRAGVDFAESAFAPFWDAIETAAVNLGRFNQGVQNINSNLAQYSQVAKQYAGTPPTFPLAPGSVKKLGVGNSTADRMKTVVRTAQRNFQFATIYEQRKTNQILVAGFRSLADALNEMSYRIASSIGDLANSVGGLATSVDAMHATVDSSSRAIHSQIGRVIDVHAEHHDEILQDSGRRAKREEKVIEMLDNIQRGRKPLS